MSRKAFHRNWARLIQKVYHTDPLLCPKCNGSMRIISFIEEEVVIKQILSHLNLWMTGNHDPPEHIKAAGGSQFSNILEIDFDASLQIMGEELIPQMPYEDEYSQVIDCPGWET